MKTISRSRMNFIQQLFAYGINGERHINVNAKHSLTPIEVSAIRQAYNDNEFYQLKQQEDNRYQVNVHNGLWYTFEMPLDEQADEADIYPEPEPQAHVEDELNPYLEQLGAGGLFTHAKGYTYGYTDGQRYHRVYREFNGQRSVVSFVDKKTGTIYKSKGWKSASKTVIGNLQDYQSAPSLTAEAAADTLSVDDAINTVQAPNADAECKQAHTESEIQSHPEIESQEAAVGSALADELGAMATECEQALTTKQASSKQSRPKTTSDSQASRSGKVIYIAPSLEIKKQAKPETKAATEVELLRRGSTKEEILQALGWKDWSHSRSTVLKLGYGLRRDEQGVYTLVDQRA